MARHRGERLAWMLARVNQRLEDELADKLKPEGVAIEQFRILEKLTRDGSSPMSRLAKVALVEPPTMTKIIDRMVASGLVFRAPDEKDRRMVRIVLTEEGAALYARVAPISEEQELRIEDLLDRPRTDALRALLTSLS